MEDGKVEPRVGLQVLAPGGRGFAYGPLPDDAVIRFRIDDRNTIDVRMEDGELVLHHDSREESLAQMVVIPKVSNVVHVAIRRKEGRPDA